MSNKPNFSRRNRGTAPQAAPARRFWESPITWVLGLVLVALIVTIAVTASGGDGGSPDIADETAFVELRGTALAPFADPEVAIGRVVPALSAETLDGDRVEVVADGTARLYAFFAHWCPHCQAELPRVVDWLAANPLPAGVEVIAISTAVERSADNYPPSAWFEREGWPATVLMDDIDGSLAAAFGLTSYPFWVATNGDGEVVVRTSGELTVDQLDAVLAAITPSS